MNATGTELRERAARLQDSNGLLHPQNVEAFALMHIAAELVEAGDRDKRKLEIAELRLAMSTEQMAITVDMVEQYRELVTLLLPGAPALNPPANGVLAETFSAVDAVPVTFIKCDCENGSCEEAPKSAHRAGGCTRGATNKLTAWGHSVKVCDSCADVWKRTAARDIESITPLLTVQTVPAADASEPAATDQPRCSCEAIQCAHIHGMNGCSDVPAYKAKAIGYPAQEICGTCLERWALTGIIEHQEQLAPATSALSQADGAAQG
ncbi:MAG: hypothetical protein JWO13_793 [Acidobacteriales bacterium]|nr:hypothetical protein [Terriglobales bacterium]